jgi:serine phosphatase RsbU (regulator of sigma subunit)
MRIVLVEDDDGDALLVEDLLALAGGANDLHRARSLAEAEAMDLPGVDCALLDLDLPDAVGLDGLHRLLAREPELAVLVLTGFDDERRGLEAVAAGAQDYLVKGRVDGFELRRAIRYAVERRRAHEARQQLELARVHAEENARLERGLLPVPLVTDPALRLSAHYRPGRRRALLGGDFYDAAQLADGDVHAVIGDVSGHGPDEAALGVALRIAWRALLLGGCAPDDLLPTLQVVLSHERHSRSIFTTLCMVTVSADRRGIGVRLAGHPPPLVLAGTRVAALDMGRPGPPLGVIEDAAWPLAESELPDGWALLLYTDGLMDGRRGDGDARLGDAGLARMVEAELQALGDDPRELVHAVVERAEALNGGPLLDDVAAFLIRGPGG